MDLKILRALNKQGRMQDRHSFNESGSNGVLLRFLRKIAIPMQVKNQTKKSMRIFALLRVKEPY